MRKRLALLMASLFLIVGTAWAQVSEGQAYFLKVVGVENAYIDAKTNKGGNRGGTIGVSSAKVPVYFQKDGDKWKISTDEDFNGGFLKVKEWDVNPQQTTGTSWTIESAGDGIYRLKQGDFTTGDGPYLGCENLSATVNLYSNRPEAQAVKVRFVEAYKIELTTDVNNPKWYTIKNVRGEAYAYYNGDATAMGMSGVIDKAAYLFYFTEGSKPGTYKIHNSVNSKLCVAPNSWTDEGIDWYIKLSGNLSYPGWAISKQETLTDDGDEAWNDSENKHTSVAWYGGDDAGSTWDLTRYEYSDGLPTIQLSTEGNIVLHYIRSIRRDSYVNFDGHNVVFKEGAQGLNSYWYFVQDKEAQQNAPAGFIACKIYNAAHETGVENHSTGFMGTSDWPTRTYYIGTHVSKDGRNGYVIYRPDADLEKNGCWHDFTNTKIIDYDVNDDGSHWRIYPAGKTGADLINEATTAKNNALSTIALYEKADYYTYSDDAIATAKAAIEAVNTNELHTAVAGITSIPAAMETLQVAEKSSSAPAVGDYIQLNNRNFGGYLSAVDNDGDKIRKMNDKTNFATLWKVEKGTAEGSVKLKNVGNSKYMGAIAKDTDVQQKDEGEAADFTFTNVVEMYAAFQTAGGNTHSFANYNSNNGGRVLGWEKSDKASQWLIEQAYPLTVIYQSEGVELTEFRVEQAVEPGTVYTIENRDAFGGKIIKSVEGATENGAGAWTVTVNAATTVTVTLGVEDTDLYALKSPTGTYFNFTKVLPEPNAAETYASFQNTPSFVYKKAEGESYYFEDLNTSGAYIGIGPAGTHWIVAKDNKALWNISSADANGYVTISRSADANSRLGHDGNTNVGTGIFTNVGANCNKWQLIPAYPITIVYKNNSNDEEIETVKTAVIAGAGFSYDIDTKSYEFVSCETDKGSIEVEDGTCTIAAVNGATTITILLAPVQEVVNPDAVVALVNRIGGTGTANNFKFVLDRSLEGETFVIGAEEGKILIKGSTISAITTGIGWYLNNIAHINIAWNSLNEKTTTVKWDSNAGYADLSNLPLPSETETHTSDAKYRYYLNYCTFGYSMTSWTWTRWQQEIDWMALHGINMPLQIVGLEEVWRKFLTLEEGGNRKYNYTDQEAKAFVAGPAFTAWWGMNNLEGWGGTAEGTLNGGTWAGAGGVQDDAWYTRQQELAGKILKAQRDLGMQPVLPGFSGMVPTNFTTKTTIPTDANGGKWVSGFQRPRIIDPTYAGFAEIAKDYYDCLTAVMGESQYYSMDPFHEGGSISSGKYTEAYYALYEAMEAANPGSQWIIQQWQWDQNQNQIKSVNAVPAGRLIVLDLFSDGKPAFDSYSGYAPQDAVFCAIPNFGGRSGLMGRLQNVTDNYFKFKEKYPTTVKGIGTAPEAIEQTPVTYDLIYQLPWMNGQKPNVAEWVDNYAVARYGKDNAVVKEAWSLLRQGPLNYGADGIQGPVEDVWAARPNLNANPASAWGKTLNAAGGTYTLARRQMLIDATYKLLGQKDALGLEAGSVYESNYLYDLVEFGGAVMADYAYDLLKGIKEAKEAAGSDFENNETYRKRRDAFLALIEDVDAFKGTNLNFRLGKWTQEARDAAGEVTGATTATPDWYEFNNARTIISTWSSPNQNLNDYSYRSWQGLMKDLYLPRWQYYFSHGCTDANYGYFEWNWAHGLTHEVGQTAVSSTKLTEGQAGYAYTREPENKNTVEKANEMLGKYIIPVPMADGTHYAYRYLTNDLSNKVTIIATGNSIDLTQYFGALEGATVTGEFMDGSATELQNIPLKSNLADGAYTGTITLADGTVLTFGVSVNPKYNGTYKIKYSGDPVFIQYHTVGDNSGNVGYKVVTTKKGNGGSTGYSADYEADQLFTITPSGAGFALSAQGQYLKTTASSGWNHIMFSEQKGDAGTYTISEPDVNGLVKLKSTNTQGMASVAIFDNGAWGNDVDGKAISFSLEEVTTYAITIPASGYYGICLPFNVVLPTGVTAYDVTVENLTCGEDGAITSLASIATEGQILKAGTPALLKGTAGNCNLTITMDNTNAKTSSVDSKLRGNFVKQTLAPGILNKFIYTSGGKHPFVRINDEQEIPANTCWIEANIDAENVEVTEHQGKVVKVDDWLFSYQDATNGIKLIDAVVPGDGDLEISENFVINGKAQKVVAISPDFLHGRTDLTSVTLPSSLTNLGFREVEPMFETSYEGKPGDGVVDDTDVNPVTGKIEKQGMHSCLVFPNDPNTGEPYEVSKDFAWKLTLDVTVDKDSLSFNNFGSAIVSTNPNSLADDYFGYMQIYMWKDLQNILVKIDCKYDRYIYNTPATDENGDTIKAANGADSLLVNKKFKFELEHDGSGGYQVVVYYSNNKAKMYNISASENNKVGDFDRLYYSLPEGIHVNVKFEKLISQGLFVGCTNLREIKVHPDNPTFKSCEHGVLYDKSGYYVMRIPEGDPGDLVNGRKHFEIPSKVVKLYAGSFHGVSADIVLHSNPIIGVVEGHKDAVKNAKFFLSLDDIDGTIAVGETGHGGARDFISTNNNTYQSARYKRAPLAPGVYGTIILPFAPTNALTKYDFFKFIGGDATSLTFSQVDKLEAQTPYLYKLKETPENMTTEDGLDVFETLNGFEVKTLAKYDPNDEKPGGARALGAYVNYYIETKNYPNSGYYYYKTSAKAFYKVTNKLTYRPYRVIFVVTPEQQGQAAQAPARLSLRLLDGTTTDIDASLVEGMETPVYYDLSGRRVLNPGSGVYIVNGKKVFIK